MPLQSNGQWTDFIDEFIEYSAGPTSPEIFRLWSAIAGVAGALERRVWAQVPAFGDRATFPNLYVMLVGTPGVGKQVIEDIRGLWAETVSPGTKLPAFHVAPDSVSRASLMDELGRAKATRILPTGPAYTYQSLLVAAEEFQVLLPGYDQEFIATLNSLYNNKNLHRETRRASLVKDLVLERPQLTILGGAQPAYFVSTFPDYAWDTGLSRRIIMVYSGQTAIADLWLQAPDRSLHHQHLLVRFAALSELFGPCRWTDAAGEIIRQWHLAGGPPAPSHSKLRHYNTSRTQFIVKLAIISAISRTGQLVIAGQDASRAISWLLAAESTMPDIFREMVGKSDAQVLEEMHYFVTSLWAKNTKQGVRGDLIWQFLAQRAPSPAVPKLFELAEKMSLIARQAGTGEGSGYPELWIPRPMRESQLEIG